jgi:hypothetical protein
VWLESSQCRSERALHERVAARQRASPCARSASADAHAAEVARTMVRCVVFRLVAPVAHRHRRVHRCIVCGLDFTISGSRPATVRSSSASTTPNSPTAPGRTSVLRVRSTQHTTSLLYAAVAVPEVAATCSTSTQARSPWALCCAPACPLLRVMSIGGRVRRRGVHQSVFAFSCPRFTAIAKACPRQLHPIAGPEMRSCPRHAVHSLQARTRGRSR